MSTAGGGAHNSITYSAGQWTWHADGGAYRELYDSSGRLSQILDRDGNETTYQYDGYVRVATMTLVE